MASKKKRGLGRGLDALLPGSPLPKAGAVKTGSGAVATDSKAVAETGLMQLDPRQIAPNPWQPRHKMDPERLEDLAQSIRENGVLQPALVRRRGDKFEVIAGERRVRASIQAGLESIPVVVADIADEQALEAALIENVQREDLNPLEEAQAYDRLVKEFGMTQDRVAQRVGKSRVAVANSLRLLKLPPEVQKYLETGDITAGHGRAILACNTVRKAQRLTGLILDRGLSVREAEEWVQIHNAGPDTGAATTRPAAKPQDPHSVYLAEQIMMKIGLKARVKVGPNKKGKVEIYFGNMEDLERLTEALGIKDE